VTPEQAKGALRAAATGVAGAGTRSGAGLLHLVTGHGATMSADGSATRDLGESGFDADAWQRDAWNPDGAGTGWESWLASSWSASSWSASSWSASSWSSYGWGDAA
jgi:hypothetical protein